MFDVRAHVGKNRLYVTLSGALTEDEARSCATAITDALDRLRPRFDVVANITGLLPLEPHALPHLKVLDAEVVRRGGRRVVRVVGKSAQAAAQLEKAAREAHLEVYLAYSLEEAERMLNGDLQL